MSNLVMGRIFKSSGTQSNDRLMMLCIGDNADDHGHAWPGGKLLADKMGNKSRSTAAVRIDALSQTNELGVYPKAGDSHHYLVFTGMTFNEARIAIRRLAKKFKVSTGELAKIRRAYQVAARQRLEARKSKKLKGGDTPSIQPRLHTPPVQVGDTLSDQGVTDIVIHEPSLTLIQPPVKVADATPLTGGTESKDVFKLLHTLWGRMVSGAHEMQQWVELENDYPIDWIEDAMKEAVDLGGGSKLSLRYIRAPLARWKAEGREVKKSAGQSAPIVPLRRLVVDTAPMNEDDRQRFLRDMEAKRVAKSA